MGLLSRDGAPKDGKSSDGTASMDVFSGAANWGVSGAESDIGAGGDGGAAAYPEIANARIAYSEIEIGISTLQTFVACKGKWTGTTDGRYERYKWADVRRRRY